MLTSASSISLRAARVLRPGVTGRVLASFERVCDLVTDDGAVVALVWDGIENGPLNVVLEHGPGVALPAGTRFAVCSEGDAATSLVLDLPATVSLIAIDLASAAPWNPQPDWDSLRALRPQIIVGAGMIVGFLAEAGWSPARCGLPEALCKQVTGGSSDAIRSLAGLGPGLTPAGDDWLAGWLLARHLAEDLTGLRDLSGLIQKIAAGRTTTLSRALLESVAAGEADATWQALMAALSNGEEYKRINVLAHRILGHGATSGAAMLFGFCAGAATPDSVLLIPKPD